MTTAARAPDSARTRALCLSLAAARRRHAAVAALVARRSRRVDVVYATSMVGRTSLACPRPLVVKVAGDPAFERRAARPLRGTLEGFQPRARARAAVLRRWRTLTSAGGAPLLSERVLRGIVISWGIAPERVSVAAEPDAAAAELPPRDELRASFGVDGPTLAFAGRLTPAKALDVLATPSSGSRA